MINNLIILLLVAILLFFVYLKNNKKNTIHNLIILLLIITILLFFVYSRNIKYTKYEKYTNKNIKYQEYENTIKYVKYTNDKIPSLMKKYNVIFAATCRNVEMYVKKILDNIEKCSKKFNEYCVIIYENDSTDNTRKILNDNKKSNYYYIFEDNIKETRRTKRIERGRNLILDKIRELNANDKYQYLIVLDMDEVNYEGKFVNTINTCFSIDDWDVLGANQLGRYYDTWALRILPDNNYDCAHLVSKKQNNCGGINYNFKPGEFITVNSAFGGTTIYKLSSIPKHCKYNGAYSNGKEKCEHVDFNKCIKNSGGKIYINSSFINDG